MSSARTSKSSVSTADVNRVQSKREENRNHFSSTVLASIYPTVPQRILEENGSLAAKSADADLLAHLDTVPVNQWVERVRDYSKREINGFDPTVVQLARFETKVVNPKTNREESKFTSRYLAPQDKPDSGLLFMAKTDSRGKAVYEDGEVVLQNEPIGRWSLARAEREVVTVYRPRSYVDLNGEQKPVSVAKIHSSNGQKFVFLTDIDPLEVDPSARIPVITEGEPEEAQVMQLDDKFYAHRNFLGTLTFDSGNGRPASWPVMDVDKNTVKLNRDKYNVTLANWEKMAPTQRREARKTNRSLIPQGAGFEAFLVKKEGILARTDNMFVEVERSEDSDNEFTQVVKVN